MTFKEFLIRTFTWWNGTTWGTAFYTWRRGQFVGEDEFGNRYYQARGPLIDPSVGPRRRWVVYNGEIDASKGPPGWRGWLAFTSEVAPSAEHYVRWSPDGATSRAEPEEHSPHPGARKKIAHG